jgi:uncharacterized membrane protein YraQ (UPF0718 family)
MNNILAGLLAAVPLSALGIGYMVWRGRSLAQVLTSTSSEADAMSEQTWFYLMLGSFALAPFVFGVLAGLVYSWIGDLLVYRLLALGLAGLFSVLAVLSRTPLVAEKIGMSFSVALVFGLLVPFLAAS